MVERATLSVGYALRGLRSPQATLSAGNALRGQRSPQVRVLIIIHVLVPACCRGGGDEK